MELDFKVVVSLCLAYLLLAVFFVSFINDVGGSATSEFNNILDNTPDFTSIDLGDSVKETKQDFLINTTSHQVILFGEDFSTYTMGDDSNFNFVTGSIHNILQYWSLPFVMIGWIAYNVFGAVIFGANVVIYIFLYFMWVVSIFAYVSTSDFIPPLVKIFLIVPPTVLVAYLLYQVITFVNASRGK